MRYKRKKRNENDKDKDLSDLLNISFYTQAYICSQKELKKFLRAQYNNNIDLNGCSILSGGSIWGSTEEVAHTNSNITKRAQKIETKKFMIKTLYRLYL